MPVITGCDGGPEGQNRDKWEAVGNRDERGGIAFASIPLVAGAPRLTKSRRRRGAIYARYSSRFQHSIDDQIRECRKWAEANGVDVGDAHVFIDEATTGKTHRRKGFAGLMQAIEKDEVDTVIIFVTSRLFRKSYKCFAFVQEQIVDRQKRCVFVKSGIDTDDATNWSKLMHLHSLVDEMAIQMQAAHIHAAHEGQLRLAIVFGTLTYGFTGEPIPGQTTRLGKPARRLVIDPATITWVQRVFAWFVVDEISIAEIVRRLNDAKAPLPQRRGVSRWSYNIVRRMLDNARHIGHWQYGAKQAVWQSAAGYSRQVPREEPLHVEKFEHLRIIDDATWHRAQTLLAKHTRHAGRKPKDGHGAVHSRLLNCLCVCAKHASHLVVGGSHGSKLFCRACVADPEPELVSMLPRDLATILLCEKIAELIQTDTNLLQQVSEACVRHAADLQLPDPAILKERSQEEARLTRDIQFIMESPGETAQDMDENKARLQALRRRRAAIQAEIQSLAKNASNPVVVPDDGAIGVAISNLAHVLCDVASSVDETKVAAARRVIEAITGGRIVATQQGERKAKHGWLRLSFEARLIRSLLYHFGVPAPDSPGVAVVIDVRAPLYVEEHADPAKDLLDQGLLVKQIATELSRRNGETVSRNMVTKAIAHWFTSRGLTPPDGRTRRASLLKKSIEPSLYEKLAPRLMALFEQGSLLDDIALQLDIDRNTVTAIIKRWHNEHGLPVPDGRTRRKSLTIKSRPVMRPAPDAS